MSAKKGDILKAPSGALYEVFGSSGDYHSIKPLGIVAEPPAQPSPSTAQAEQRAINTLLALAEEEGAPDTMRIDAAAKLLNHATYLHSIGRG